jgi:hypothetical protein
MAVRLQPHVHWAEVDRHVFILDERTGEYLGLGGHDVGLWGRVCDPGTPADEEGLTRLRADAVRRGWYAADVPADDQIRRIRQASPPTTWRARRCLFSAFWRIRVGGFPAAYQWARRVREMEYRSARRGVLADALDHFLAAESTVFSRLGERDCLPRSLALFVFLRRSGFPAQHCIGVRALPFAAHAWVEDASGTVLEDGDAIRQMTVLTRLD